MDQAGLREPWTGRLVQAGNQRKIKGRPLALSSRFAIKDCIKRAARLTTHRIGHKLPLLHDAKCLFSECLNEESSRA
jgi:hypothetical protein